MEYYHDNRCCDYYENDRVTYEERPHLQEHHHHTLFNSNNPARFAEQHRLEDNHHHHHGGHHGGRHGMGESMVVTYKVEETDYSFEEGGKEGEYHRQHYPRRIY